MPYCADNPIVRSDGSRKAILVSNGVVVGMQTKQNRKVLHFAYPFRNKRRGGLLTQVLYMSKCKTLRAERRALRVTRNGRQCLSRQR